MHSLTVSGIQWQSLTFSHKHRYCLLLLLYTKYWVLPDNITRYQPSHNNIVASWWYTDSGVGLDCWYRQKRVDADELRHKALIERKFQPWQRFCLTLIGLYLVLPWWTGERKFQYTWKCENTRLFNDDSVQFPLAHILTINTIPLSAWLLQQKYKSSTMVMGRLLEHMNIDSWKHYVSCMISSTHCKAGFSMARAHCTFRQAWIKSRSKCKIAV